MERQLLICVSRSDFDLLAATAVRTGQPLSAVLHTLIERTKRDQQANARLALQISALVNLHALNAAAVVEQLPVASTPAPAERGERHDG